MKSLKIYVAGKVSKDSHFGRHDWRDEFLVEVAKISGRELINIDPTKSGIAQDDPSVIFGGDSYMIAQADAVIVYLSDDISIGGSQEILIAKYFQKPVIGLAPHGGKFNGSTKEYFGSIVHDYKDPFVFSTCDVVCSDIQEVGEALKRVEKITPKSIDIIGDLTEEFMKKHLQPHDYLRNLLAQ